MLNKDSNNNGEENWEIVGREMEEQEQSTLAREEGEETTSDAAVPAVSTEATALQDSPETQFQPRQEAIVDDDDKQEVLDEQMADSAAPLLEGHQNTQGTANEQPEAPHDSAPTTPHEARPLLDTKAVAKSFRRASRKIKKTVKEIDQKHKIQESTVSGLKTVGASAKAFGNTIRHETERVGDCVKRSYEENDVQGKAKAAAQNVKQTAVSVGRKAKHFNEKYRVTEKIASAAVIVGAFRFAKGDHRGGTSALAVAGASYLAGEAMRAPAHSTGLNEDLHME